MNALLACHSAPKQCKVLSISWELLMFKSLRDNDDEFCLHAIISQRTFSEYFKTGFDRETRLQDYKTVQKKRPTQEVLEDECSWKNLSVVIDYVYLGFFRQKHGLS